ncbi:MAG: ABC transporter ATP-binding protein [Rhodospirillaceae bacterium]|nr:ABC transporter ATP-binding protein [Rhodospirillaceae bacterium]
MRAPAFRSARCAWRIAIVSGSPATVVPTARADSVPGGTEAQAAAPILDVTGLEVAYAADTGPVRAVDGVGFALRKGEFFTLLGPSGCGKTTTLRSVAGFEAPTAGTIAIAGRTVFDGAGGTSVPVHRRDIAMVFQSYAIWPHMSVAENVAFPLAAAGLRGRAARVRVQQALDMVGLGALIDRPATQLSGGQQQRVALARAIAKNAALLLLDEPLSNLDAQLREQMRGELAALQARLGTTTLYVTHDQEEALSLSDRVALMRNGRIVECGTPQALYYRPQKLFTARFIGRAELVPCTVRQRANGTAELDTPLGTVVSRAAAAEGPRTATLMLRPEHVAIVPEGADLPNRFPGTVRAAVFLGRVAEYDVELAGLRLKLQSLSTRLHEPGDRVTLHVPPERCVVIDET